MQQTSNKYNIPLKQLDWSDDIKVQKSISSKSGTMKYGGILGDSSGCQDILESSPEVLHQDIRVYSYFCKQLIIMATTYYDTISLNPKQILWKNHRSLFDANWAGFDDPESEFKENPDLEFPNFVILDQQQCLQHYLKHCDIKYNLCPRNKEKLSGGNIYYFPRLRYLMKKKIRRFAYCDVPGCGFGPFRGSPLESTLIELCDLLNKIMLPFFLIQWKSYKQYIKSHFFTTVWRNSWKYFASVFEIIYFHINGCRRWTKYFHSTIHYSDFWLLRSYFLGTSHSSLHNGSFGEQMNNQVLYIF